MGDGDASLWLTPESVTTIFAVVAAVVGGGFAVVKSIKANMAELKPNGGASLRDAIDRIEATVSTLEAQLRGRLELEPGGSFLTDAHGGCLWVDSDWQELTGVSLDEALGEGWIMGIHAEDRVRVFEEWRMACRVKGLKFNMSYRTAKGIQVKGDSVKLIDSSGSPIGHLGVITPVQ